MKPGSDRDQDEPLTTRLHEVVTQGALDAFPKVWRDRAPSAAAGPVSSGRVLTAPQLRWDSTTHSDAQRMTMAGPTLEDDAHSVGFRTHVAPLADIDKEMIFFTSDIGSWASVRHAFERVVEWAGCDASSISSISTSSRSSCTQSSRSGSWVCCTDR